MKTKILPLQWPAGVIPSDLPNFETEARRLRYQALGKACYEKNIPSLLLGHHQADEEETLVMRLIGGYRGEGLRGISEEADFPECQGIYGVSQSGGRDYTVTWEEKQMIKARDGNTMQKVLPPIQEYRQPGFEYGGVRIFRPLMTFSKSALEVTLSRARVLWVIDPTNSDPTLSIRNAIRYLLRNSLLPKALGNTLQGDSSALKIAAKNIRQKFLHRNKRADELFQACDIISFDARSGCLKVRIPLSAVPPSGPSFYDQSASQQQTEVEHIGARLVRILLSIVSPRDNLSLQTLEFATKAMFWHLESDPYAPDRGIDNLKPQPHTFTAGDVLCQRVKSPSEKQPLPGALPVSLDLDHTWCLSRRPYIKTMQEPVCLFPPTKPFKRKEAGKGDNKWKNAKVKKVDQEMDGERNEEKGNSNSPQTLWQLWDGRYWIQLINPLKKPLKICPLSQDRLARLKANLTASKYTESLKFLDKNLGAIGPPHVRHTIPAVMDDKGNCLALPTLDFRVPVSGSDKSARKALTLKWHVRYKRVVFPDHVKHERIIALKEERLEGVKILPRVAEEEERDKPRQEKKLEKKEKEEKKKKQKANNREKEKQVKGKFGSRGREHVVRRILG